MTNLRLATLAVVYLWTVPGSAVAGPVAGPFQTFPQSHECSGQPNLPVCSELARIKSPDTNPKVNQIYILPHRGLWGYGDMADVAENSASAFRNVSSDGFKASEVDFTPSSDGVVMSHDYVLSRTTNSAPGSAAYTFLTPTATLQKLRLRNRFGAVTADKFLSARDALDILIANDTVVFGDLKQLPNADPAQFARNWVDLASAIIELARDSELKNIVLKTSFDWAYLKANLSPGASARMERILWMPQVASDGEYQNHRNPGVCATIKSSVDFIESWSNYAPSIAAFEVNYKAPDDSRLQPIFDAKFSNLLSYIMARTGLRGGAFAEEPVGQRGIVDRWAIWKLKDGNEDQRGDPIFEAMAPEFGNKIVVTTDRADIWKQFAAFPNP